ncbi:hypothetical protein LCGC14_2614030 [marine sediment metagenome]|uniref:MEDS domain-containing protein n=1 Tax=marine sediment metagenome TaxID=412755 RepID=A0A0F9A585_9ZZZZ
MILIKEAKQAETKNETVPVAKIPMGPNHLLFYKSREELINMLIPFFKTGLENNQFCIWGPTRLLNKEDISKVMAEAVPCFDEYTKTGQMTILPHDGYDPKESIFSPQSVFEGIAGLMKSIKPWLYDGIRLTGDRTWFE